MKTFVLLLIVTLAVVVPGYSATTSSDADAAARANARATYPTPSCVVSGEHLEAGKIVEYVYKQDGKPDRLVRLCCNKCVARFKANPAKYLAKLDAAAAANPAK